MSNKKIVTFNYNVLVKAVTKWVETNYMPFEIEVMMRELNNINELLELIKSDAVRRTLVSTNWNVSIERLNEIKAQYNGGDK